MLWNSLITGQEAGLLDSLWILLLPVLCCLLLGTGRGERRAEPTNEVESWYTSQEIDATYSAIEQKVTQWRQEAEARSSETKSIGSRIRGIFGGGSGAGPRFVVREAINPRLYRVEDDRVGPIYFELTPVEGGGTVVRTTYTSAVKNRMARFKAELPLKIPATPVGNRCPACGKPVLPEFIVCPYCGEKLIRE